MLFVILLCVHQYIVLIKISQSAMYFYCIIFINCLFKLRLMKVTCIGGSRCSEMHLFSKKLLRAEMYFAPEMGRLPVYILAL